MQLPPELQNLVCRDLVKAELKVARLVCKSLDQAAIPFLFDEVFVAARYRDLEIADLVASRFGTYVKTMTLSFVEYEDLSMGEWYERTYPRRTDRNTRTSPRSNGHLAHAFGVYSRIREETLEIIHSGDFMAKLCVILRKSPNTRRMTFTDCGNYCDDNYCGGNDPYFASKLHPHDPWSKDELCPFKGCQLSDSDHLRFHVRPSPPYNMTPNPFHLAILAISTAKSTITEFAMIHDSRTSCCTEHSFLTKAAFVIPMELSCCLNLQLEHLSKLRIRLGEEEEEEEEEEAQAQNSHASSPIAKALSSAVNLESLFIEGGFADFNFRRGSLTTMSCCLGGCQFPLLKSLILRSMNSKEDELLEFLKASPDLKHITLVEFTLVEGSWETTAQTIRSTVRLESILFDQLSGQIPDLADEIYYSVDRQSVDDFFLHNGKNPFTKEAMSLGYREYVETSRAINKDLACEERYRKFH